MSTILTLYFI